jgi:hypothetical protein
MIQFYYIHATEEQAVFISLVVGNQVEVVEHSDLKDGVVGTQTQVAYSNYTHHLKHSSSYS